MKSGLNKVTYNEEINYIKSGSVQGKSGKGCQGKKYNQIFAVTDC